MIEIERPDWHAQAACRGMSPSLFFPSRGDTATMRQAQAVCRTCECQQQCADAGLHEHYGVWGGGAERHRRRLRQRLSHLSDTSTTAVSVVLRFDRDGRVA